MEGECIELQSGKRYATGMKIARSLTEASIDLSCLLQSGLVLMPSYTLKRPLMIKSFVLRAP